MLLGSRNRHGISDLRLQASKHIFELCFPFSDDVFSSQTRIVNNFVIIGRPTFKILVFFMLL